jgi:hypothetical protein
MIERMFDQLADLEARLAALVPACDSALDRIDGTRLGDVVLRLDTAVRRLEALRLRVSAAHAASREWHDDGARSAADWHRARRHLTRGQAARELQTADGLQDLPKLAEQVAAGDVSVDHAAVVARAARDVPVERLEDLDGLAAATASTATTRELRDKVTDFVHRVRPDVVEDRERRAFEARDVQLGRRTDGTGVWIQGRLDVIGGEELLAAISALSAPRGDEDERTAGQRRADALADLAGRALRHDGDLPADGGQRPHVGVVVPFGALVGDPEAPAAQLGHVGPVSAATARQLACDAGVHRVVTAGRSEILDVGRSRRVVTVAQRRALTVRDGGCVGCGAPPAWTDAHHIRHWADGGPTDLDNLVLLCRSCHTSVHHRRWTIMRDDTGRLRAHPPPRHGDPPRTTESDSRLGPHRERDPSTIREPAGV